MAVSHEAAMGTVRFNVVSTRDLTPPLDEQPPDWWGLELGVLARDHGPQARVIVTLKALNLDTFGQARTWWRQT